MSRKKRKSPRPKVTAPVTPTMLDAIGEGVPGSRATRAGVKEPVIKTTMSEINEAMDFAQQVGMTIGKIEGVQRGLTLPRTKGEARAKEQKAAVANILQEVFVEAQKAISKHGPMHSGHEGYAVIKEELDELWDEIKANRSKQASARAEAIQVAAMAVRYALDIDPR